jgi:hypothetical protein
MYSFNKNIFLSDNCMNFMDCINPIFKRINSELYIEKAPAPATVNWSQ